MSSQEQGGSEQRYSYGDDEALLRDDLYNLFLDQLSNAIIYFDSDYVGYEVHLHGAVVEPGDNGQEPISVIWVYDKSGTYIDIKSNGEYYTFTPELVLDLTCRSTADLEDIDDISDWLRYAQWHGDAKVEEKRRIEQSPYN